MRSVFVVLGCFVLLPSVGCNNPTSPTSPPNPSSNSPTNTIPAGATETVSASTAPNTSSQDTTPKVRKAFLDQKKGNIPPNAEWNREIVSRVGGNIDLRITSSVSPFSITVLTDKAFQAVQRQDWKGLNKADVFLMIDTAPGQTLYEGVVKIPAGSSYIMIANASKTMAEFHLECFESIDQQ